MFPAGLGIKTWFAKKTRFPKNNNNQLFYVEQLMNTPSFCMWNSQTERKRKQKNKQKKIHHTPILVLKYKTKTKHTHLKRCLYYNHLPQPLKKSAAHRNYYKKKPSWSSDWVKKFLEQDPNADDYDKYSLPLGTEDTNEEILSNTEGIEGTRLNNTGHASSSKNWLAEAQLSPH